MIPAAKQLRVGRFHELPPEWRPRSWILGQNPNVVPSSQILSEDLGGPVMGGLGRGGSESSQAVRGHSISGYPLSELEQSNSWTAAMP